jgi:hypothetical protein
MTYCTARALRAVALTTAVLLVGGSCELFRRAPEPGAAPAPAPRDTRVSTAITSTPTLFAAIRARYGRNWYRTLTFTGENIRWSPSGQETRSRNWAEYVSVPGRLRIEFLPWTNQSGVLFEGGRVHTFDNGRRIDTRAQTHPLLLLTSDLPSLSPEAGIGAIRALGVNTQRFRETTWQRRRVYVVGGERGDTTSTQVWFDAQTLMPVRWIHRETREGRVSVGDTRIVSYRRVSGYPVPREILGYRDGHRVLREVYHDVRVNPSLSPQLFDPERWRDAPRPRR